MSAPKPVSFWNEQPFRAPALIVLAVLLARTLHRLSLDHVIYTNLNRLGSEMDRLKTLETMVGQGIVDLKVVMDNMHSSRVTVTEFMWSLMLIFSLVFVIGMDADIWSRIKGWCHRNTQ